MCKKLVNEKIGKLLFLLCWIAYFTSYLGRLNYSSAMSSIIEEGMLTFTEAGTISMIYFFAYGIGQLCNGILGDKVKPERMIFLGLFCSGIVNLFMPIVNSFVVMGILWGANGYAQSMIWPPIIRIFAEKYTYEKKVKYSVDIVSSMAIGTLMSYFLSACAMKLFNWHAAFYVAALFLIAVSFVWMIGYGKVERSVKTQNVISVQDTFGKNEKKVSKSQKSLWEVLVSYGLLIVILPVMIHGILKDGVTQWVPTYIYDSFQVSASFSVIVTMILPIVNLSGAYMARYFSKKHPDEEIKTSIYFFGSAVTALVGLFLFGKVNIFLSAFLFAMITASMMAVNTLYVNMIPLHFEKEGRVSTVSGFLNSVAYLGSALSTFTIGIMVERAGWTITIGSWTLITAVALLVCVCVRNKKYV